MANRGKPAWIPTDKDIRQIETMAGIGLPIPMIAAVLGVSKSTIDRRISDNESINEAISKGRAVAAAKVTQTLFNMATSGENTAATIFWCKTRLGWSDNAKLTIQHEKKPMSIEEARKLILSDPGYSEDPIDVEVEPLD